MKIKNIKKLTSLADYLSISQIYLKDNFFLEKKLEGKHIKNRLLGHWGTVPGLNFVYANLNALICEKKCEMLFIAGPGHGFPAVQSHLFIEGTLTEFYGKKIPHNKKGIEEISKNFSAPYGYPSHLNPGAPGAILEGGELGYSLSTAFGAVFDNPDLIASCVIGDGEAETATIATAWHSIKFLNPKTSGAVLPIVHLNGYKISGPTIFSMMSDEEISDYFSGLGYEAFFVSGNDDELYEKMAEFTEKSYERIKSIQKSAREKDIFNKEKYPVIILKTPKGWGTIKEFHGEKMEGNSASHQVVLANCKNDEEQIKEMEKWLKTYKIDELLDENGKIIKEIQEIIPKGDLRMGMCKCTIGGNVLKKLELPKIDANYLGNQKSAMKIAGKYLKEIFKLNKKNQNFRLFSPDETYSNKIGEVFEETSRAYMKDVKSWEKDLAKDGRVMEMLSEHTLQGWLEGYLLTGRHGIFVSYEAFIQVVASMVDQFGKFLYASKEFAFRKPIASLNFILTSLIWRQDHNGFSHQNPGFISGLLDKHGDFFSVYFPADANSMLVCLEEIFEEKDNINVIISGKRDQEQYLSLTEARQNLHKGIGIWEKFSDKNPDVVISSAGDYITAEALEGIKILRKYLPEAKIRYVNVCKLTALGIGTEYHSLAESEFDEFFTKDKNIIFTYHGYSADIKKLLFGHKSAERFVVNGYSEEGSTTTPLDMMIRNGVSRYQVALNALNALKKSRKDLKDKILDLEIKIGEKIISHRKFIVKNLVDPENLNEI